MALRMRKDIKKSSYYVWFLGAQESKGLRGAEYIHPVVKSLVQRERDVEPFKVTLQVSHKGLKLIQNIPPSAIAPGSKPSSKSNKPEVIKHFIPHHAVTCVLQDEDIVSCILLLYNPVTKCPVHVHAYRCDSVETAEILRGQLQTLIERPENQKKIGEIETRLRAKGLLLPPPTQPSRPAPTSSSARRLPSGGGGSDGRSTSTRESESSGGSSSERLSGIGGHQERIANLYDSLAAELREKLGTGGDGKVRPHAPILLPPRDYDTVHRQKGNLTAIDLRRCLNANIVGVNAKNTRNLAENGRQVNEKAGATTNVPGQAGRANGSSGGSSGIGSDHAPSADGQDRESDPQYLENPSSSDEEWNEHPSEDSLFLVQPTAGSRGCSNSSWRSPGADLSLPRARRVHSSGIDSPSSPVTNITGTPPDLQAFRRRRAAEERQRSPSPSSSFKHHEGKKGPMSPRDRFKDAKEKFLLLEEQEKLMQRRRNLQTTVEQPISPAVLPTAGNSRGHAYPRRGSWSRSRDSEEELEERRQRGGYFGGHALAGRDGFDTPEPNMPAEDDDDDVFEHGYSSSPMPHVTRRESYNNRQVSQENLPHQQDEDLDGRMPLRRGHRPLKTNAQVYRGGRSRGTEEPRLIHQQRYRSPSREDTRPQLQNESPPKGSRTPPDEDIVPERRQIGHRFRSPRRVARGNKDLSPDRRERFLSPTRNPRPQQRKQRKLDEDTGYPSDEVPRYRNGPRERTPNPSRGHRVLSQQPSFGEDSHSDIPLERYRNPQPAPRHRTKEDEDIGSPEPHRRNIESRLPRANPFQIPAAGEKKRRSMFEVLEEERRRSSNELAKEFKRRSYQDGGGSEVSSGNRGGNRSNNGVSNGRHPGYQELSENERFPGLDRDTARLQHHNMSSTSGGHLNLKKSSGLPPPDVVTAAASRYRHSYAEPHHMLSHPQPSHHHEILHRTNSSVSSGRVGIAAVHPY